jgi:hypothetical protein
VAKAGCSLALSQLFSITPGAANPAYLVLNGLDRDEYTATATYATGQVQGAGAAGFASLGGDAYGLGLVFQYQPATGRYWNGSFGYLDQITYRVSSTPGDITDLSLFWAGNARLAQTHAADAFALMQADASGYLGTITIATEPDASGSAPDQATPDAIAAVANEFVGRAWNMDGCWVLACTIAAKAGASESVGCRPPTDRARAMGDCQCWCEI